MNIFILDENPIKAAQLQCDKHVVKMVLESAQMLSTVHRVCDGTLGKARSKSGKTMVKVWELANKAMDNVLYKAVHVNHPCTVWTGESLQNYIWHYEHFEALATEFTYRYGKQHKSWVDLEEALSIPPRNIPSIGLTKFKLAMGAAPECMLEPTPVAAYRKFYQTKQARFDMSWSHRSIPEWFEVNSI